jgi:hypothetical protein
MTPASYPNLHIHRQTRRTTTLLPLHAPMYTTDTRPVFHSSLRLYVAWAVWPRSLAPVDPDLVLHDTVGSLCRNFDAAHVTAEVHPTVRVGGRCLVYESDMFEERKSFERGNFTYLHAEGASRGADTNSHLPWCDCSHEHQDTLCGHWRVLDVLFVILGLYVQRKCCRYCDSVMTLALSRKPVKWREFGDD